MKVNLIEDKLTREKAATARERSQQCSSLVKTSCTEFKILSFFVMVDEKIFEIELGEEGIISPEVATRGIVQKNFVIDLVLYEHLGVKQFLTGDLQFNYSTNSKGMSGELYLTPEGGLTMHAFIMGVNLKTTYVNQRVAELNGQYVFDDLQDWSMHIT